MFQLNKIFTTKDLRKSYKELSLRFHPDKCKTNKYFAEITKYYEFLSQFVSDAKEANYMDLKNSYNEYSQEEQINQGHSNQISMKKDGKFDIDKFNAFFQENKFVTEGDNHGYGDWLKSDQNLESNNIRQGISNKDFNSEFDKIKNSKPVSSDLSKYNEPKMVVSRLGTTLGEGSLEDYSGTEKSLVYTDLKIAHNNSGLINPNHYTESIQSRPQSIDQIDSHRANISYTMDQNDRAIYESNRRIEENAEINRMIQLRQTDSMISKH